jgi:hypothetical protein
MDTAEGDSYLRAPSLTCPWIINEMLVWQPRARETRREKRLGMVWALIMLDVLRAGGRTIIGVRLSNFSFL